MRSKPLVPHQPPLPPPDYSIFSPGHGVRKQPITSVPERVDITGGLLDQIIDEMGSAGIPTSPGPTVDYEWVQAEEVREEVARLEVTGESGGGMVKVTMTGKHEVRRVQIEPAVVGEDREMLEDLIAAAFNDAVNRANEASQARMSQATAGMPLPPGMKLPF